MAEPKPIIPGRRTITRVPTAPITERREGRIDSEYYKSRVWRGGTTGEVVDQMSEALGTIPDGAYHCEE